jgi:hypothetical protein
VNRRDRRATARRMVHREGNADSTRVFRSKVAEALKVGPEDKDVGSKPKADDDDAVQQ